MDISDIDDIQLNKFHNRLQIIRSMLISDFEKENKLVSVPQIRDWLSQIENCFKEQVGNNK